MTKAITTELQGHLASSGTTLCTLWKLTRKDGVVMGFTDNSFDLLYGGLNYLASTGFTPSAVSTSNDLAVDNLDVAGVMLTPGAILTSNGISEADLEAGVYDYAEIVISQVNYEDLTQGEMILRKGVLGQVSIQRGQFTAEVRGLAQALQQTLGRVYMASCDADLGDSRCKVNLAPYTVTGVVSSVISTAKFSDATRTEVDQWFQFGLVTWVTGDNVGLKMEVKSYALAGGAFVLTQAMPYPIQIGDEYTVYAGCNKTFAMCKAKFNNVINFQGFPYIPGQDQLIKVGTR
jgi:uncharacterized phage protein (TIGR02218 family)